jgi:hypothetical protein
VTFLDVVGLSMIVVAPTLIGASIVYGPRWIAWIADAWPERRDDVPVPVGLPIQQLAADLRRLLRLHTELSASAHLAMRAHRLWAVEAAIAVRAVEAARALGVPHREPEREGELSREELGVLLESLSGAGLVLPAKAGPFTRSGRL